MRNDLELVHFKITKLAQGFIVSCPCHTTSNAKRKMSGLFTNRVGSISILISRDGLSFSLEVNELVSRIPFILHLRMSFIRTMFSLSINPA